MTVKSSTWINYFLIVLYHVLFFLKQYYLFWCRICHLHNVKVKLILSWNHVPTSGLTDALLKDFYEGLASWSSDYAFFIFINLFISFRILQIIFSFDFFKFLWLRIQRLLISNPETMASLYSYMAEVFWRSPWARSMVSWMWWLLISFLFQLSFIGFERTRLHKY